MIRSGSPLRPPSPAPEIVLDLSRLLSRVLHATPTGIDRVEMAYARTPLRLVPDRLRFGATHPFGHYGSIPYEAAVAFLDATEARWETGDTATAGHVSAWQAAEALWRLRPRRVPAATPNRVLLPYIALQSRWSGTDRREDRARASAIRVLRSRLHPEYARPGDAERHHRRLATVAAHSDAILVNSRATADALAECVGSAKTVCVAPLGTEPAGLSSIATADRPYFVCLGTVEPRKNHLLLLNVWRAMGAAMGEQAPPRLVVVGRRGWENENMVDMLDRCPALAGLVDEMPSLPDRELRPVLRGARALLMPSFAEGYGLPIAEALAAGALDLHPRRADIWVQYGQALKESGSLDSAEAAYCKALELAPELADTHLQLGHLLKIAGRGREAAISYLHALEISPQQIDALREIQDLGHAGVHVPAARLEAVLRQMDAFDAPETTSAEPLADQSADTIAAALDRLTDRLPEANAKDCKNFAAVAERIRAIAAALSKTDAQDDAAMVFDASDLIYYFRHTRLPTGIQRVQIEIIASLARSRRNAIRICCLFHRLWVEIPVDLFLKLAELSANGSGIDAPAWRGATGQLEIVLDAAATMAFLPGAYLINLGTSWHVDYLLQVRIAKRKWGIRFAAFVHDLIPIVAPQFVVDELTRDYVGWLLAVFDHADLFLTNSEATRRDLVDAAHRLGRDLAPADVTVVRLDARFAAPADPQRQGESYLRRQGLMGQPFVLMVGTVEPRKNHTGAIDAWAALLADPTVQRLPKLVCVGGRGWMTDSLRQRVAGNAALARHILFLHDLSDIELAACYDACLFTLFPSFYEGWGLPVTESLSHGKVPLLSDAASLPEAGGEFGEYYPVGDQAALATAVKRLIIDPDRRRDAEQRIAQSFRPRGWGDIAEQIAAAVEGNPVAAAAGAPRDGVPNLRLGCYYPFARNDAALLRPGLVSGEALRAGGDWYTPESWGCWAGSAVIELAFRAAAGGQIRTYLGVGGLPERSCLIEIAVDDAVAIEASIPASATRWLPVDIDAEASSIVRIEVRSDSVQDLTVVTAGADDRTVGPGLIGFYACTTDDIAGQLAFVEAASLGVLSPGPLHAAARPEPVREAVAPPPSPSRSPPLAPAGTLIRLPESVIEPNATRSEIVIMQSSDPDRYAEMLALSARTTKAYCERHGFRYVDFLGIKRGCLSWHAAYNRIDMLMDLIADDYQGWVFYIDADAWITNLDFDLRAYLVDKTGYALIGAPAGPERDHYWNINNGVLLINLGHSFARACIVEWERFLSRYDLDREALEWNKEVFDDQGMLHQILDKLPYAADYILVESKQFMNSPWASFVRQAIRAENSDFDARLAHIAEQVDEVLAKDASRLESV